MCPAPGAPMSMKRLTATFVAPWMCGAPGTAGGPTRRSHCTSRREALHFLATAAAGAMGASLHAEAARAADEKPGLPAGAAHFSRLIGAQRQWSSLEEVVGGARELDDEEWESLRGYLRTVYGVSGDMDFLARSWDSSLRKRGDEVIKRFRTTVKGMDKPAAAKNQARFATMHAEVAKGFEEFFTLLKEASVKDIPDEL